MANRVIVSERWKLNLRDWIKTAVLKVGTPMVFEIQKVIQNALDTGNFDVRIDWRQTIAIGLSTGVLYALKQFTGAPKVTTVYNTNDKAVDVACDIKKG